MNSMKGKPMNHKKFEEMILMPEALTPEERATVNKHIASCEACRKFALQWQKASRMLNKPLPMATPSAGFSTRFAQSIEKRKEAEQQQQVRRFITILVISLLAATLIFAVTYYSTNSLETIIKDIANGSAQMLFLWESLKAIISTVTGFLPAVLLIPFVLTAASTMLTLTLLWLVSMWKLTLQKETVL
jgi:predicted anti-sigma-YlaC factor YlaD